MPVDPTNSRTVGWHLFFEPTGESRDRLQILISDLAEKFNGLVFSPHVTLLARIPAALDAENRAERIAKLIQPFQLTFDGIGMEYAYFRALYLKAAHASKFIAMHARAADMYDMTPDPAYLPHLSLLYGNYGDEEKTAYATRLEIPDESIHIQTLSLYRTEGEASDWVKVREFDLG